MIVGLQITDKDGNPLSFRRAFVRNFFRSISFYLYCFIIPAIYQFSRFKQTRKLFHDEWSNTVIGDRPRKARASPAPFRPSDGRAARFRFGFSWLRGCFRLKDPFARVALSWISLDFRPNCDFSIACAPRSRKQFFPAPRHRAGGVGMSARGFGAGNVGFGHGGQIKLNSDFLQWFVLPSRSLRLKPKQAALRSTAPIAPASRSPAICPRAAPRSPPSSRAGPRSRRSGSRSRA